MREISIPNSDTVTSHRVSGRAKTRLPFSAWLGWLGRAADSACRTFLRAGDRDRTGLDLYALRDSQVSIIDPEHFENVPAAATNWSQFMNLATIAKCSR